MLLDPIAFYCRRAATIARAGEEPARVGPLARSMFAFFVFALLPFHATAQIELPSPAPTDPIHIQGRSAMKWTQGAYEVWVLRGDCRIQQGQSLATGREAVVWIDRTSPLDLGRNQVIAYLEGEVSVDLRTGPTPIRLNDSQWLGRFSTRAEVHVHAPSVAEAPPEKPAIYERGLARRTPRRDEAVRRTQFFDFGGDPPPSPGAPVARRRVRVFPRGDVPVQAQWFPDRQTQQWIGVIDSGVNLIVDGLPGFGSIDVSTDRLVIWTTGLPEPDLTGNTLQDENIPLEIYMEGNIVFRQGDRVIRAERMYYDVTNQAGTVLDAEMLTPVPEYEGLLRLHAQVIQQTNPDRFFCHDTFLTSSRMGQPGYRVQVGDVYFEDIQTPRFNPFTGQPEVDPETGQPVIQHERLATGRNGFLYIGDVPVFYWPAFTTDLTEPTFYLRRAALKNDSVFGSQILTDWDGYQLFGIRNKPAGTDWDISLDYLSDRGLGHGTTFTYSRDHFFALPGPTAGLIDFWGIQDHGTDNLGRDRRSLPTEADYRYKLFWQHRQRLPSDLQLSAEVGWISDRNFLEQYYEREWDELKDPATGVELKQLRDNTSWSATVDARLNDFFTETEWLPRLDHFWLGQPLLNDAFTWYEHSNVGYGRLRVATAPEDPAERARWVLEDWEVAREGERLVTRQELDWPLQLGLVKVVPYALGELAHWGEDINGDDLQRFYWQAGLRASVPMWRVDPMVENNLFNVHGLAHKIVFDAEFAFAQSNRDLSLLPLYDPLDDVAIEAFRYRMPYNTFGFPSGDPTAKIPLKYDERYHALRSGLGGWVTSPSTEIADDLTTIRLGARQRWQTKRGRPDRRKIIDWITFDTNITFFPDADRDNFGTALGPVDYDLRWHVGDRLTMVSDGYFDFFDGGLRTVNIGGFLSRPPRGRLYVGLRLFDGPINSQILSLSYDYHMSPKWISTFGMSVDLGDDGNIGQNFGITRVGESLLISAGFNVDASKNNVGVNLAIEPRFLPKSRLGRVGGAQIPAAGAYGLE